MLVIAEPKLHVHLLILINYLILRHPNHKAVSILVVINHSNHFATFANS